MELTNELITKAEANAEGFSIDVITQTNLEFRMIHSESSPGNNDSQWIFPDEHLDAQAGNYLLTVSQTYKLYLVSVFYTVQ